MTANTWELSGVAAEMIHPLTTDTVVNAPRSKLRGIYGLTPMHCIPSAIERFSLLVAVGFTMPTFRDINQLPALVKEPHRANAEPILLLPFCARPYGSILPHCRLHPHGKLWSFQRLLYKYKPVSTEALKATSAATS